MCVIPPIIPIDSHYIRREFPIWNISKSPELSSHGKFTGNFLPLCNPSLDLVEMLVTVTILRYSKKPIHEPCDKILQLYSLFKRHIK